MLTCLPFCPCSARSHTVIKPPAFLIQQIELFQALPDEKLAALVLPVLITRKFTKNSFVIHKGSDSTDLHLLLQGRLQVEDLTPDGQEVKLDILEAPRFFGEIAMIDRLPHPNSVRVLESALVGMIHREHVYQLMAQEPVIATALLQALASSVRLKSEQKAMLNIHNIQKRLFALLCKMAKPGTAPRPEIAQLPTQMALAGMINTSRESISRALSALQAEGAIARSGRRVQILRSDPQFPERHH